VLETDADDVVLPDLPKRLVPPRARPVLERGLGTRRAIVVFVSTGVLGLVIRLTLGPDNFPDDVDVTVARAIVLIAWVGAGVIIHLADPRSATVTDDTREPGLNSLEVVIALLHATALTTISALFLPMLGKSQLQGSILEQGVPTGVGLAGGMFVTWSLLLLGLASRRPPRTTIATTGGKVRLVLSGLVTGLLGLPALAAAFGKL
jgi:hypothetical protein